MAKDVHGQCANKFYVQFFVFKRKGDLDNELCEDSFICNERKKRLSRSRFNRRCGICLLSLAVLVTVFAVYPKDKLLNDWPNRLSNYFQTRNVTYASPEVRHIGFLKVHKAGGTTIQNILFRYGLKRNLSFVMPATSYKVSEYRKNPYKLLRRTKGRFGDILALHSIYNETVYSKLLPGDSVYVAIVRDPLELMVSAAFYYRDVDRIGYLSRVPGENFIRNLVLYPELYDQKQISWTRNSMAMDFGFPDTYTVDDVDKIRRFLLHLSSKFQLVMVLEYLDESLIFLKRLLKCEMSDVLYLGLNHNTHPSIQDLNITTTDLKKFELRNFLDVAIYKHFSGILMEKIASAEPDFHDEVHHFKRILSAVQNFCRDEMRNETSLYIKSSDWNNPFQVSQNDCFLMSMKELHFIDKLRRRMLKQSPT